MSVTQFVEFCRRLRPPCLLDIIIFTYFDTYGEKEGPMPAEKPDAAAGVTDARDVRKGIWHEREQGW